jgi:hypothetical protein
MSTTPSAWPSYDIGPHDSVFALGVASSNYARLEFALANVFCNVLELSSDVVRVFLAKTNNDVRLTVLQEALNARDWPPDRKERVSHFIKAFEILSDNRNQLMHSGSNLRSE